MKKKEERKNNIQKAQCAKANRASPVYIDRDYAMLKKKEKRKVLGGNGKRKELGRLRTASLICDPLGYPSRRHRASPAAPNPQTDLGPSQELPARAGTFLRRICHAS